MKIYGSESKYKSLDEYLMDGSSYRFIDGIRVPLLAVSTLDDPICSRDLIPYDKFKANPYVLHIVISPGKK